MEKQSLPFLEKQPFNETVIGKQVMVGGPVK